MTAAIYRMVCRRNELSRNMPALAELASRCNGAGELFPVAVYLA